MDRDLITGKFLRSVTSDKANRGLVYENEVTFLANENFFGVPFGLFLKPNKQAKRFSPPLVLHSINTCSWISPESDTEKVIPGVFWRLKKKPISYSSFRELLRTDEPRQIKNKMLQKLNGILYPWLSS